MIKHILSNSSYYLENCLAELPEWDFIGKRINCPFRTIAWLLVPFEIVRIGGTFLEGQNCSIKNLNKEPPSWPMYLSMWAISFKEHGIKYFVCFMIIGDPSYIWSPTKRVIFLLSYLSHIILDQLHNVWTSQLFSHSAVEEPGLLQKHKSSFNAPNQLHSQTHELP